MISANVGAQLSSKDELILQLQRQIEEWKTKYQALAKLYSQLRSEHLDLLNKSKAMQLRANSAQEAVDRMERMERDVKAKNLELADMIKERDRSRFDVDRLKSVSPRSRLSETSQSSSDASQRCRPATRVKRTSSTASRGISSSPTSAPTTRPETSPPTRPRSSPNTTVSSPSSRTRSRPSRSRLTTYSKSSTTRGATTTRRSRTRTPSSALCRRAWTRRSRTSTRPSW